MQACSIALKCCIGKRYRFHLKMPDKQELTKSSTAAATQLFVPQYGGRSHRLHGAKSSSSAIITANVPAAPKFMPCNDS
ncbi:hypothetical protein NPIL_525121 [Nephila pilipes]|uniref:Uncharacterized protein n=1 Tax=Nephila pilipes TaxID=299642 RepID=A0A8X6P7U7_NEPPI|nr:hypothetical protein NPIL_525121 [Nephila pilipes]